MRLLRAGGRLLIGDLPNISKKGRFLASASGRRFDAEYKGVPLETLPVYDSHHDLPSASLAQPETSWVTRSDLIIDVMRRYRHQGYDVYILEQPLGLPFCYTREVSPHLCAAALINGSGACETPLESGRTCVQFAEGCSTFIERLREMDPRLDPWKNIGSEPFFEVTDREFFVGRPRTVDRIGARTDLICRRHASTLHRFNCRHLHRHGRSGISNSVRSYAPTA